VDELDLHAPDVATEVTLRPSKSKAFVLLFVWIAFLFGGVWLVQRDLDIGWIAISLAVLGILSSLINLGGGSVSLTLSPEGFAVAGRLGTSRVSWGQVHGFRVEQSASGKVVWFDYVDAEYEPHDPLREAQGRLPDNYGLDPETLRDLLETWQRYHAR
jgi:hypothetical protein